MRRLRTWLLIAIVLAMGWVGHPAKPNWARNELPCPVGQVLHEVTLAYGEGADGMISRTSYYCLPTDSLLDPFATTDWDRDVRQSPSA